jgi:drug/metabolite transporter (DMT)-like permease
MISTATVFEILYLRSFFALFIVMFVLYFLRISPFDIKVNIFPYLAIRCMTAFIGFAIEFFSIKFTDLSKVVIILYNPFLTSIMSFLLIGETVNKHDLLSFFLGVLGIAFLTDPFAKVKSMDDLIGISLACLSAVFFNIGFIALRKVKSELNSWQIVFFFQITNMFFAPICFTGEKHFENMKTVYQFEPYSLFIIFIIGVVTVVGNFCVN